MRQVLNFIGIHAAPRRRRATASGLRRRRVRRPRRGTLGLAAARAAGILLELGGRPRGRRAPLVLSHLWPRRTAKFLLYFRPYSTIEIGYYVTFSHTNLTKNMAAQAEPAGVLVRQGGAHVEALSCRIARGGSIIRYKSPLNVLKDTYDHSCC
jgi:hypothetical protein